MYKKLQIALSSPAYQLIITTATRNWSLLVINLATNVMSAVLEGSTLGVIYLAVSLLSPDGQEQQPPQFIQSLLSVVRLDGGQQFLGLLGVAVFLQVLLAVSNYGNKLSTAYLSARAQPQVTGRVFEQIMSFSFACASHYKVGDLLSFSSSSALTVNNQISGINNLIVSISFTLIYAIVLISLSPSLALMAVLLALIVIGVQQRLLPRLRAAAHHLNSAQVELSKRTTENIQALRLLHTFGTQQRAIDEVLLLLRNVQGQLQRRAKVFYLPEPILDVLPILSLAILAAVAFLMSDRPESIMPLLLTFLLALQRLAIRLRGITGAMTQLADNSAQIQRLDTILNRSDKEFAQIGGEPFTSLQTDICFEGVSLSYANDSTFAVQNLSFTIPKNQVTALVGQSGAGKSSIVDLLIGLYQPTVGQITVNGSCLQQYDQANRRCMRP